MIKKAIAQNIVLCALLAMLSFTLSCKKSPVKETPEGVPQGTPGTRIELTKDSIYLYAQQTYFWNQGMPRYETFNPRQYNSNDAVLAAIKELPSTGNKDKYSFIDDGTVANQIGGVSGNFGFSLNYDASDLLRITYVYQSSSADEKGLKRGYQIVKINDRSDLSRIKPNVDFINNALASTSIRLTLLKPDGNTFEATVTRTTYKVNPILFTKTYTVGAKKVGYIVFNSFTSNAVPLLDAAFSRFSADGVSELIVDLRYNGGGDVGTAQSFTNLIAPSAQNNRTMFTMYWTKTMQDGNATILQNQKFYSKGADGITRLYSYFDYSYKPTIAAGNQEVFAKRGSLSNLSRVYFIVTGSTASASELLINNLKPVMDVKLIGKKTYGKPVGFFALHIDKLDLYIPQFQTKNQRDEGDYFDGMSVDKEVADDLSKDFGDPSESLLAQALYYSANGAFTSYLKDNILSSTTAMPKTNNGPEQSFDHEFKGMVETRKPKLK